MPNAPNLDSPTRALLWLDHVERRSDGASIGATQGGIAEATGLSRSQASRILETLASERLVVEQKARPAGYQRAITEYRLTGSGQQAVARLLEENASRLVEVRCAGTNPTNVPLKALLEDRERRLSLWDVIGEWSVRGYVDLLEPAALAGSVPRAFVRDLSEAPRPGPFVGREAQLENLRRWLDSRESLYVLEAPGGFGKSALVAHLLRQSAPRSHLLWVRLADWTTGPRLADRLERFFGALGRPGRLPPPTDLERFGEKVRESLRTLPVLLVVDDAQNVGVEVRGLLRILEEIALGRSRLRIILIGRQAVLPPEIAGEATRGTLPPLSRVEAAQLLERIGVSPVHRQALVEAAGGSPMFLKLLARHPENPGAGSDLADYVARDLMAALGAEDQAILRAMSAVRTGASSDALTATGPISAAGVERLVRQGLLVVREDGRFELHDVLRGAIHTGLSAEERRRIHVKWSDVFRPQSGPAPDIPEYLHHLAQSGRPDEAIRWLLRHRVEFMNAVEEVFRGSPEPALAGRRPA